MNTLDDALLMLLVQRLDTESEEDLFNLMKARYDARLNAPDWGPLYKVGPTFVFGGQKFCHIQTLAGSFIMRVIFDTRKGNFDRPVIYRFNSVQRFRLLTPGGSESEVDETELVELRA